MTGPKKVTSKPQALDSKSNARTGRAPAPTQLGSAIRHRRKALGLTLDEVARAAELTTGFISQIERGISAPSLSSLMAVAAALNTSIEQLVQVREEFSEHVPKDRRQTYTIGEDMRLYEKLGPGFAGALFYPLIVHRPPGHVSERMFHSGEVFCYLMAGQIEYHLDGKVHVLSAGDTIHHSTAKPHFSRVLGDTETVELWVSTTPGKSAPG